MPYYFWAVCLTALLASCGGGAGGDNQQITEVKVQTLALGKKAVISIAGLDLRFDMTVQTGVCTDPTFDPKSVPQLATLNCTVTALGEQPITIFGSNGQVLYKGTLTVRQPRVILVTSKGNITMELAPEVAPLTVLNFLYYVNQGYYSNTIFHRVIPDFVAQGGGFTSGMLKKAGQLPPIALESNKGLSNLRATVAMARAPAPNSATSEFFVNLKDNPFLDYESPVFPGYAVFGKVTDGMAVVDEIATVQTQVVNGFTDVPVQDVTITLALQIQ